MRLPPLVYHCNNALELELEYSLFRLFYWLGSFSSLCYWNRNTDFLYLLLLDFPFYFIQSIIYSLVIWGIYPIIYFYILCQYSNVGLRLWTVGRRTVFKVVSAVRQRIRGLRGGLRYFVKVVCVAVGWH